MSGFLEYMRQRFEKEFGQILETAKSLPRGMADLIQRRREDCASEEDYLARLFLAFLVSYLGTEEEIRDVKEEYVEKAREAIWLLKKLLSDEQTIRMVRRGDAVARYEDGKWVIIPRV